MFNLKKLPEVRGYVARFNKGIFLGKELTRKDYNAILDGNDGASYAFVHTPELLKTGGLWSEGIELVMPATYDPQTKTTIITGVAIPYETFCAQE